MGFNSAFKGLTAKRQVKIKGGFQSSLHSGALHSVVTTLRCTP